MVHGLVPSVRQTCIADRVPIQPARLPEAAEVELLERLLEKAGVDPLFEGEGSSRESEPLASSIWSL